MHYPNKRRTLRGRVVRPIFRLQWSSFARIIMQQNPPGNNNNFSPLFTVASTPCQMASFNVSLPLVPPALSIPTGCFSLSPPRDPPPRDFDKNRTTRLADVYWTKRSSKHLGREWFGWNLMFFVYSLDDFQVSLKANPFWHETNKKSQKLLH